MGLLLFCAFVMLQPQDLQILWQEQLLEAWTVWHRGLRLDLSCHRSMHGASSFLGLVMASYIGLVISAWCMHAVSNSIGHGLSLISEADMCKLRPMTTEEKVQKQKHTEGLH